MEDENKKLKSVGIELTISAGSSETHTVINTGIPIIKMFLSSSFLSCIDRNPLISTIIDMAPRVPNITGPGIEAIRNINLGQNERTITMMPAPTAAQ